jgi:hypothetical protein
LSKHTRPKKASDVHDALVEVAVGVGLAVSCVFAGGSSPSRHPPNQPGYLHDEVEVDVGKVVVTVGAGAGVVTIVLVVKILVSSLQPNQPGVLHVEVDIVVVIVVLACDLVVDSSKHPHHPGVLQVSVLVRLDLVDVDVAVGFELLLVVVSVPLLSKYSHV